MHRAQELGRVIAQRQLQPDAEQRINHDVRAGDHIDQHPIALIVLGVGDE